MGSGARAAAHGVTPRIVRAGKEHLEGIVRIERESFTDPWSEQAFFGMIDSPLAIFLVGLGEKSQVIGYAAATAALEDGEILNVAVDGAARGQGTGGALLDSAIASLKDQLVRKIYLEVRESNEAAIALYRSRGFAQVSVRRSYYRHPVENAVVMCLDLAAS